MTKDTITGVSTIVVDHGRNKQLFYYGAFNETRATQTMKTNHMVELIDLTIDFIQLTQCLKQNNVIYLQMHMFLHISLKISSEDHFFSYN